MNTTAKRFWRSLPAYHTGDFEAFKATTFKNYAASIKPRNDRIASPKRPIHPAAPKTNTSVCAGESNSDDYCLTPANAHEGPANKMAHVGTSTTIARSDDHSSHADDSRPCPAHAELQMDTIPITPQSLQMPHGQPIPLSFAHTDLVSPALSYLKRYDTCSMCGLSHWLTDCAIAIAYIKPRRIIRIGFQLVFPNLS